MSAEFKETNLKASFRKVLSCAGIGAAETIDWAELITKKVKPRVGEENHSRFVRSVLMCAIKICTEKPYEWIVRLESQPIELDDNTTFEQIYKWYKHLLRKKV